MPSGLIPDAALSIPLKCWLGNSYTFGGRAFVLWVNDYTPDHLTTWADLTEASFGGYARMNEDLTKWFDSLDEANCSKRQYGTAPLDWPVSGGPVQTIFGWALYNLLSGAIEFVQRFDTADQWTTVTGQSFSLQPTISATQSACPGEMTMFRASLPLLSKG